MSETAVTAITALAGAVVALVLVGGVAATSASPVKSPLVSYGSRP
ncbi:MAG: hypothetical protein QOG99_3490 [Frankiales bacterium]|nr:hypothetical protein [Frankiales bacterium]